MKKTILMLSLTGLFCFGGIKTSRAQSVADCIQQLVLDYQKLAGMKNILNEMYRGYTVLTKGYNAVRDVSQGNFSLHEAFLDGLYLVSPTVRKYPKVAAIISDQALLVSEYHSNWRSFQQNGKLSAGELLYLSNVFDNLVNRSLDNLDALTLVMSDNQLRMSDAERLRLIDQLYHDSREQLSYLRRINDQTDRLLVQRQAKAAEQQQVKQLYGLK